MTTHKQTKELAYYLLRVPKDEAYFLYFTFESNEGLCFYSTLDESLRGQYRDIEVRAPIELKPILSALITRLQQELRLDILKDVTILDS